MRKHFLFVLLALVSLVACKKEKGDPNPTPNATKRLKRIVETENGATKTYSFSYDVNKRLTAIASSDNSETILLTYDGSGNVIKLENREGDMRNVLAFTYSNALPVAGKFESYENAGTASEMLSQTYNLAYTIENDLVTKIKTVVPSDPATGDPGNEMDYNLSYSNGNLTKITDAHTSSYKVTFVYGNKKPVYPAAFKYAMDPGGYSLLFFAKNELLSVTYDFPGTEIDKIVTNQYTYDAEGYVLTANDGESQLKFEYE